MKYPIKGGVTIKKPQQQLKNSMKPQRKKQQQQKPKSEPKMEEAKQKIISITTDKQLYEKLMRKPPRYPKKSGDQKFLGYDGVWGEWIASEKKWTDGMWYVNNIRNYPRTDRMSFFKAWGIKCMRTGVLH